MLAVSTLPRTFNAATYFVDRHVADGRGGHVAVECADEQVTYTQLAERVNRMGHALRTACEVRIEERVLLLLFDTPDFFYAFFGAIKIGAVPVPINTLWKPADLEYVLNDSRARVVVVSEGLLGTLDAIPRERLRYLRHVIVSGAGSADRPGLADVLAAASPVLEAEPTTKDDPCFWLYSSGSTGKPKGCVHLQHDMVVAAQSFAMHVMGITARDRCFSVAKLFFAYGLGNGLYFPLLVGATAILWPGAPTAANVYAVIERHRPTLFYSVPTSYGMLLAHRRDGADFDLSSVRLASSAGEALPPAIYERFLERFGVEIIDGIGSTELLHTFIANRRGRVKPGSSGTLVPGYEARIVDEDGRDLPHGEIGNLLIAGDSTCTMYWNQHERTKDTIEGRWIRTGDKYYQDADGFFWYAGRSDDMLKAGGIWVSPVEVENALVEHAAVLECAVVGRNDHDRLEKPVAYVVVRAGVEATPELASELMQHVRSRLAEYKRPRWVEFVTELPKTATGKIQRYRLRAREAGDA